MSFLRVRRSSIMAASRIETGRSRLWSTATNFGEPLHVVGAGSIGLLWAASLRSAHYPVTLLLRDDASRPEKGSLEVTLERKFDPKKLQRIPVPYSSVSSVQNIRTLLVTTKAFDAVEAARSAKPTEGTTIIVLCNGALAVRDALKEAGLTSIFLALTTHGAYRETTNADDKFHRHVVHAGYGETVLENCESTAAVWNQAGLNCRSSADIEEMLWFKLAANCVVNPLTAVYGCTNGALRDVVHDFDTHYCPSVLNEVASVYVATMKSEEDAVQETTATNLVSKLKSYVDTVIRDTAQNKSSMWQDILKARQENRPAKTEIDYLNGYIVRAGAQRGIPCPVNQELWDRVLGLSGD